MITRRSWVHQVLKARRRILPEFILRAVILVTLTLSASVAVACGSSNSGWQDPGLGSSPPRGPSGADGSYNCADFDTQAQAQARLEFAGDVDGLDRDGDGRACTSLP